MCAVACGDEAGGVEGFSRVECCSSPAKCCSPTGGGGLLLWPLAFWKQAAPSELRGGSVLSAAGISSGAPLQCMVVCLLTMAERVKLFPQAPQVYGFSPVWERM